MRRLLSRCCLVIGIGFTAIASQADNIKVQVNGDPVQFSGIGPQQVNGRVMVPLRGVLEKLGAYVDWVSATQTVVASRGNMDLQLKIGSRTARVNGQDVNLDVPAMTLGGSTMVPLRFVGETLGADIRWEGSTQTVMITTRDAGTGGDNRTSVRNVVTTSEPPREPVRPTVREPVREITPAVINSLTHNHRSGWLKGGDVLTVRMRGTAGADGSFRIPGVAEQIAMQETSPGVYEGSWTVPGNKPLNISEAAVIGTLRMPGSNPQSAPLVQAGDTLQVDTAAPRVDDLNPAPRSQVQKVQPLISATLSDQGGSGVVQEKVRILLDGRDITPESTVTGQFFSYKPSRPLNAQDHTVEVYAYDKAGNETHRVWNFGVVDNEKGIDAVETDASGTLQPGDVINIRVVGQPGGTATWSLGPVKDRPLREEKPGVYVGSYRLRPGDDMDKAHLIASIAAPSGRKYTDTFEKVATVRTGPPTAPVITYPGPNDRLTDPQVIRGTAQPNSTVRLKIDYTSKVLGILGVRGTAAQVDVKADKDGKWETKPLDVSSMLGSRGTEYTLTAVAINSNEERSQVTTLKFR